MAHRKSKREDFAVRRVIGHGDCGGENLVMSYLTNSYADVLLVWLVCGWVWGF
jgi:hypothetical protein